MTGAGFSDPLNNFTVRGKNNDATGDFRWLVTNVVVNRVGCEVIKTEKPKPFTFMLRGLQWTTVIERTFAAENEKERNDWCEAIKHVAGLLQASDDVDMAEVVTPDGVDSRGRKLHIGSSSSSRGRKIVSF